MDALLFPQVYDVPSLLEGMQSEKNYDDAGFVEYFNTYDGIDATRRLCDFIFLGDDTELNLVRIPDNGKENVLIYAGTLDKNGITTSLCSLTNTINLLKTRCIVR